MFGDALAATIPDSKHTELEVRLIKMGMQTPRKEGAMSQEPEDEYKANHPPEMEPSHPGAILRGDVLPALGLSVAEAARQLPEGAALTSL